VNSALIVAGGSGTRFSDPLPKQYHLLKNGKSILENTVKTFTEHPLIDQVVVVVGQNHNVKLDGVFLCYGGQTRQESVRNGLNFLKAYRPQNVLIHDAVRPFISSELISQVIQKLNDYEAVDIALPITDTLKTYSGQTIPRDEIYMTQTPQGFHFDVICKFHEEANENYTDDVSIYLARGGKNLGIILGDPTNIKITHKRDLI
jgi:2-C-methyl-D-erythritol 4-phosphate cytidylyltransferase/2-C-methyl-D-erythritol 2,4-cyclodiphosphate synthase